MALNSKVESNYLKPGTLSPHDIIINNSPINISEFEPGDTTNLSKRGLNEYIVDNNYDINRPTQESKETNRLSLNQEMIDATKNMNNTFEGNTATGK